MSMVLTLVRGALIGIANIIPGVSGGTLALVLGIYERLLGAVGRIGGRTAKIVLGLLHRPGSAEARRGLVDELRRIDALWLALLGTGALLAIAASSHVMEVLLDHHLAPTLAFFIGLILPSIRVPYAMLQRRGPSELAACAAGIAVILLLSMSGAGEGPGLGLVGLFLAGAVAISAMILPGISGSFVLMVMGEYRTVLAAINDVALVSLAVFALGCLAGLVLFVRLLNLLLARAHSVTMAFLIGLIVGSIWVLWPFKEIPAGAKIVQGRNVVPAMDGDLAVAGAALLLGLVCSVGVTLLGRRTGGDRPASAN